MPEISRDVSGKKLINALNKFGYSVIKQTGSHIRLSSSQIKEIYIILQFQIINH